MNSDQNWAEWLVGTALAGMGLLGGLLRYFSGMLRREITDIRSDLDERTAHSQRDRDAIWEQMRRVENDYQKFRGNILLGMFTKSDANAMETRILAALAARRDHHQSGE